MTREQFAKMIVNAFEMNFTYDCGGFIDSSNFMNTWSCEYIATVSSLEIMNGYPDGSFGPWINVNKAEAAKMMINSLKL